MNSHIVEKTVGSIKNVDRLTDLAAIEVYNTTHETLDKYNVMSEHATLEYLADEYYQESVLAGVLIGAGVIGVAASAFFIIKKIIDSKAKGSGDSSGGGGAAKTTDLTSEQSLKKTAADFEKQINDAKIPPDRQVELPFKLDATQVKALMDTFSKSKDELVAITDASSAEDIHKVIENLDPNTIANADPAKIIVKQPTNCKASEIISASEFELLIEFTKLYKDYYAECEKIEKKLQKAKKDNPDANIQVSDEDQKKLQAFTKAASDRMLQLTAAETKFIGDMEQFIQTVAKAVLDEENAQQQAQQQSQQSPQQQGDESAGPDGIEAPKNASEKLDQSEAAKKAASEPRNEAEKTFINQQNKLGELQGKGANGKMASVNPLTDAQMLNAVDDSEKNKLPQNSDKYSDDKSHLLERDLSKAGLDKVSTESIKTAADTADKTGLADLDEKHFDATDIAKKVYKKEYPTPEEIKSIEYFINEIKAGKLEGDIKSRREIAINELIKQNADANAISEAQKKFDDFVNFTHEITDAMGRDININESPNFFNFQASIDEMKRSDRAKSKQSDVYEFNVFKDVNIKNIPDSKESIDTYAGAAINELYDIQPMSMPNRPGQSFYTQNKSDTELSKNISIALERVFTNINIFMETFIRRKRQADEAAAASKDPSKAFTRTEIDSCCNILKLYKENVLDKMTDWNEIENKPPTQHILNKYKDICNRYDGFMKEYNSPSNDIKHVPTPDKYDSDGAVYTKYEDIPEDKLKAIAAKTHPRLKYEDAKGPSKPYIRNVLAGTDKVKDALDTNVGWFFHQVKNKSMPIQNALNGMTDIFNAYKGASEELDKPFPFDLNSYLSQIDPSLRKQQQPPTPSENNPVDKATQDKIAQEVSNELPADNNVRNLPTVKYFVAQILVSSNKDDVINAGKDLINKLRDPNVKSVNEGKMDAATADKTIENIIAAVNLILNKAGISTGNTFNAEDFKIAANGNPQTDTDKGSPEQGGNPPTSEPEKKSEPQSENSEGPNKITYSPDNTIVIDGEDTEIHRNWPDEPDENEKAEKFINYLISKGRDPDLAAMDAGEMYIFTDFELDGMKRYYARHNDEKTYNKCVDLCNAIGLDASQLPSPNSGENSQEPPKQENTNKETSTSENSSQSSNITYDGNHVVIDGTPLRWGPPDAGIDNRVEKSWPDNLNDDANKMISALINNGYRPLDAIYSVSNSLSADGTHFDLSYGLNKTYENPFRLTSDDEEYKAFRLMAEAIGEKPDELPPPPKSDEIGPSNPYNNPSPTSFENYRDYSQGIPNDAIHKYQFPDLSNEGVEAAHRAGEADIERAHEAMIEAQRKQQAREQAQQQQQQNNPPSTNVAIKNKDGIIQQATFDGIPTDIVNNICDNAVNDINSNIPFDVASRIKDDAAKLATDQKLSFVDAAKRILKVYENAAANIEPQTDAAKKYIKDVKQVAGSDLSSLEPEASPEQLEDVNAYATKIFETIRSIPGAANKYAEDIANSRYNDNEKQMIVDDIVNRLKATGDANKIAQADDFSKAYANAINPPKSSNEGESEPLMSEDASADTSSKNTELSTNTPPEGMVSTKPNEMADYYGSGAEKSKHDINVEIKNALDKVGMAGAVNNLTISGDTIINTISQSISKMGEYASPEAICRSVDNILNNSVYKVIHDDIIQYKRKGSAENGIARVGNLIKKNGFMSNFGEAITTLCAQVRDICCDFLNGSYSVPIEIINRIIPRFESYKGNTKATGFGAEYARWFKEYELDLIRDKKIQMILEMQQQQEQKSE